MLQQQRFAGAAPGEEAEADGMGGLKFGSMARGHTAIQALKVRIFNDPVQTLAPSIGELRARRGHFQRHDANTVSAYLYVLQLFALIHSSSVRGDTKA